MSSTVTLSPNETTSTDDSSSSWKWTQDFVSSTNIALIENSSYFVLTDETSSLPYNVLVLIALYLTVVGLISTIGNILFIMTVLRWWIMRNNAHMILLLNMAICDLSISIAGYPFTTISAYLGGWIFGDVMCQLYAFVCFTLSQVSMNTLVAVSIFRYIAICKPHLKHLLTPEKSHYATLCVWLHALFWTTAPLFGWSGYALEPTGISCSFDWNDRSVGGILYVMGCIIFCYVTHIGAMTWCYAKIYVRMHSLKKSHDHRSSKPQLDYKRSIERPVRVLRCESTMVFSFITANLSPLEIHVLRMNILMVLTYTLIWTPYAFISAISLFYEDLPTLWYVWPSICAKTSCMMNPIIYGLTNKFLRKELFSVIRKCLGLTTPIEEFQAMRQRQQEGLLDKEGVFMGARNVNSYCCTCDGCASARLNDKRLKQEQRQRELNASRGPSSNPRPAETSQISANTLIPPDGKVPSDKKKLVRNLSDISVVEDEILISDIQDAQEPFKASLNSGISLNCAKKSSSSSSRINDAENSLSSISDADDYQKESCVISSTTSEFDLNPHVPETPIKSCSCNLGNMSLEANCNAISDNSSIPLNSTSNRIESFTNFIEENGKAEDSDIKHNGNSCEFTRSTDVSVNGCDIIIAKGGTYCESSV